MRQLAAAGVGIVVGIAIGAGGIGALKAQGTKKPAYVVAEVEVTDAAGFQAYAAKVPDTLKSYNARTLVRGKPEAKEGEPPKGSVVILAFDSMDDAQKWYSTPPYAPLIAERQKAANTRVYFVEGLPQ
jgi:uncharacterized protein (DUF1330 family)